MVQRQLNQAVAAVRKSSTIRPPRHVHANPAQPQTRRQYDVRDTERDKVVLPECFRPGDIVRARVISLGDARSYMLSTAALDLGVVYAESEAGMFVCRRRSHPCGRLATDTSGFLTTFGARPSNAADELVYDAVRGDRVQGACWACGGVGSQLTCPRRRNARSPRRRRRLFKTPRSLALVLFSNTH